MKNPWKELLNKVNEKYLSNDKQYIIQDDLKVIKKFNSSFRTEKSKEDYKIHYDIHPSHYTGNLKKAKVILLATNPGYVESEKETLYKLPAFHKEMIENLDFKTKTFINLDEKRIEQGNYWKLKTEKLRNEIGNDNKVYEKIALIQFFPYHSTKFRKIAKKYFKNGEEYLKTQKFAFELIKLAIKENKIIIILRSKTEWNKAVPELLEHKRKGRVFETKNYRQPYITQNNLSGKDDFKILIETLKK
jgi:hypothetical protein